MRVIDDTESTLPITGRPTGWSPNMADRNTSAERVLGVVVAHRDLFEDHVAFELDVVGAHSAVEDHVGDQVDGQLAGRRRAHARSSRCAPWR